jgi:hypothetical protein
MTRFIDSFATQQLLPPWDAPGAQTWGFVIRMSPKRIRDYLDGYFNGPYPDRAPFHYAPLPGPQFGVIGVGYFPSVSSQNRATAMRLGTGQSWDHLKHTEVYLAFPVLRHAVTPDNLLTDPRVVWVEPFIYSDNDSVVFGSREIWGSDMYLGSIAVEPGVKTPELHLDLGMIGIKTFSPRSMSELLAVLHLRTGGESKKSLGEIIKERPYLKDFLGVLAGSAAFAGAIPEGVAPSPYPGGGELNNLKQFRDCYNMGAAIYRAIVSSQTTHAQVDNIVLFDPAKVEIAFMWSDSIAGLLTALFDADGPNLSGPPEEHRGPPVTIPVQTFAEPPPKHFDPPPAASPNAMDWEMPSLVLKAEFAFAFTSNARFEVIETLHTYGLADS